MNTLSKILISTALVFNLTGCGETPEGEIVHSVYKHLSNGDIANLKEYTTNSTFELLSQEALIKCELKLADYEDVKELIKYCMIEKFGESEMIKITEVISISPERKKINFILKT
jgi:hypothetical protein